MKNITLSSIGFILGTIILSSNSSAADFKYKRSVTLKIGQSVILKGVRSRDCGDKAEEWGPIKNRLPKSKLGKFSDGGAGTVSSNSCGGKVGGRGIRFTADKVGKERLVIFSDAVRITVK